MPGANDNASGVAGVLAVASQLARERPDGLEVVVLLCGCEESGMGGMAAWMRSEGSLLDSATTLVLGLDTVGSGEPIVLSAEGGAWPVRYRETDVAFAEVAAAGVGVRLRRWRLGAWTDPVLARLGGLPALSILSVRRGGLPQLPPARRHARARGLRLSRGLRGGLARDRPSTRRLSPA